MKRRNPIAAVAVLLVVAGVVAGGWWFYGNRIAPSNSTTAADAAPAVQTVAPRSGNVSVAVEVPAVAEAVRSAKLRSSVSGTVRSMPVVGSVVREGQVIVVFDATDARRAVARAEIALDEARINRNRAADAAARAEANVADAVALEAVGAVSREQVSSAREAAANSAYALELSDLAVQRAELALTEARDTVARMELRAPFSGTILSTSVEPGDPVGTNSELLVLADLSALRFWGEVDEFDIGKVAPNMAVTLTSEAIADPIATRLEGISPVAQIINSISVFRVSAVVDNREGKLRAGMTADLAIVIARDRGLVIPTRAVSTVRGRSYVDVLEADGSIERRRIETGANDGASVVVLDGLTEDDRVVLAATPAGFTLPGAPAAPAAGTSSLIPIPTGGMGGGGAR